MTTARKFSSDYSVRAPLQSNSQSPHHTSAASTNSNHGVVNASNNAAAAVGNSNNNGNQSGGQTSVLLHKSTSIGTGLFRSRSDSTGVERTPHVNHINAVKNAASHIMNKSPKVPSSSNSASTAHFANRSMDGLNNSINNTVHNSNMFPPSPNNDYDTADDSSDDNLDASIRFDSFSGEIKRAAVPGQFDLCGSMYKRRGGFGRNAENKWVMRCFTLYGPILCYHEESEIEQVPDPSNPRARLNLNKVETIAEMHSKHKPGLPTEHLLTINIYGLRGKKKWEMCCTSKEQQSQWYHAILVYDGKPTSMAEERDAENGALSPPDSADRLRHSPSDIRPLHRVPSMPTVHQLHELEPRARTKSIDEVELIAKAAAKAATLLQHERIPALSPYTIVLSIIVLNVTSYVIRNGSDSTYRVTLFFANAFLLHLVFHHTHKPMSKPRGPSTRVAKRQKHIDHPKSKRRPAPKSLSMGSTIPRAPPIPDSELDRCLQTHAAFSAEAIQAYAASTSTAPMMQTTPHSYGNTTASKFQLRVGPNYKKHKQKAPSGPALLDLVSMDFIYGDSALKRVEDKFPLPSIPGVTDVDTGHDHIPPLFIVNTWLPAEEPSMFAKSVDGETYSTVLVFTLSKDTLMQLNNLETASPGVKLFSEWCKRAETEADFRGRFKCMGIVEDIESTGVPKFIHGYNGKPALVTKSGTFTRHDKYIEMCINVRMWAFLARKGLYTLSPKFPEFIFNIGFTIEARKDDEMPEVLLGGCRIINLDPEKAMADGVDDVPM